MRVRIGVALLALALVAAGLGLSGHLPATHPDRDRPAATPAAGRQQPCQTSDCEAGEVAEPIDPLTASRPRIFHVRKHTIVPGVRLKKWHRSDRRGTQRIFLVKIDPEAAGVSLQYGESALVQQRATVQKLTRRAQGIVGVNGGFFDITDTGAPLGVGVDRQRGFLHAAQLTWNNAFWMSRQGVPHIGKLHLRAQIAEQPQLDVTNYNSPRVRAGAIGIYTPKWGPTSGLSVTDGQRSDIRTVLVRDGRVLSNRPGVTSRQPIDSTVLIGRGAGADELARLFPVGSAATVGWRLAERPALAISGETVLLRNRKVVAQDDSILHPRTAVGINDETGNVLLMVVDGRTSTSRGATLVEMAQLLRQAGADQALNFDGGGSSTMVGPHDDGLRIYNHPSDGNPRLVGDALVVRYRG